MAAAASSNCPQCNFKYQAEPHGPLAAYIEDLLHSNESPRDAQLDEIRAKVAVHTERLSVLDAAIPDMETTLRLMKEERERVSVDLSKLKEVSKPIRRLPEDVLCELFLGCIDEDIMNAKALIDSLDVGRAPPWILSRICSRWRRVAKSYPKLWSTICLNLDAHRRSDHISCTTGSRLLLGVHLQRSSSNLLNVLIFSRVSGLTFAHSILEVLLPSAYRWKHAFIVLLWSSLKALEPVQGSLDSLEALRIKNWPGEPRSPIEEQIDMFRYAPRLRTLRCEVGSPGISIAIPWAQLTTYEWVQQVFPLPRPSPRHIEILRRSPLLEDCLLDCSIADEGHPGAHLTLSKLRHLNILVGNGGVVRGYTDLLDCLTLPALEYLSFSMRTDVPFDTGCIISLLHRSQCSLLDLGIASKTLASGQLLELLQAIPTLERSMLTFQDVSDTFVFDEFFAKLKWPSSDDQSQAIVPRLNHFKLATLTGGNPSLLVEMIESRLGVDLQCSNLQSVTVKRAVILDSALSSRMEACCSRGFKFINGVQ